MKNIFRIRSLLFFVMMMVFFGTNLVLADGESSRRNKQKTRRMRKSNKNRMKNKRGKKSKSKSKRVIVLSDVTEEIMEKAVEKTVMKVNPEEIYDKGMAYLDKFDGDKEEEDSIQVGNYYLDIPADMSKDDAKKIVKNIPHLSYLLMAAACNDQFNLGALAVVLDQDNDYSEIKKSNENKIKKEIQESDFYQLSKKEAGRNFIKKVIILELKSLLKPEKDKSFFKYWFTGKSFKSEMKKFIKNNYIFKEIELFKNIRASSGLDQEIAYLVASMAYHIENKGIDVLESPVFSDIVHAITIPLNFKLVKSDEVAKINYSAHKEMRELYKKMLKVYDISKVEGLEESKSAQFVVESTLAYVLTRAAQVTGVLGGLALAAGGASAAKNLYYRDEKDKDKSNWEVVKEGLARDSELIGDKVKSGANYVGSKVSEAYDKTADSFERNVLRREKGRIALREDENARIKTEEAVEAEKTMKKEAVKALLEEAKEAVLDASLSGDFSRLSAKEWEAVGKELRDKWDSLDEAQRNGIIRLAVEAVNDYGELVAGLAASAAVSKAGGIKAIFNRTKTKGKEIFGKVKAKFNRSKDTIGGAVATEAVMEAAVIRNAAAVAELEKTKVPATKVAALSTAEGVVTYEAMVKEAAALEARFVNQINDPVILARVRKENIANSFLK